MRRNTWNITLIKEKTNFINVDPQLPWLKIHPTCALHAEKYLDYHIDQREDELHQCRSAATMAKDSRHLHFAYGEIPGLSHWSKTRRTSSMSIRSYHG